MCYLFIYKTFVILQIYQRYLDLWTPHIISRWVFAAILIAFFGLRICISQVWCPFFQISIFIFYDHLLYYRNTIKFAGMVCCDIRIRNLSSQFIHSIPHAKNWSCHGFRWWVSCQILIRSYEIKVKTIYELKWYVTYIIKSLFNL